MECVYFSPEKCAYLFLYFPVLSPDIAAGLFSFSCVQYFQVVAHKFKFYLPSPIWIMAKSRLSLVLLNGFAGIVIWTAFLSAKYRCFFASFKLHKNFYDYFPVFFMRRFDFFGKFSEGYN